MPPTRRCATWCGRGPRHAACSARRASTCRAFSCATAGFYRDVRGWTKAYRRWLTTVRFDHPAQQIVLQDYIHAVEDAEARLERLERQIEELLPAWSMAPVVEAVQAMRGVALIVAVTHASTTDPDAMLYRKG